MGDLFFIVRMGIYTVFIVLLMQVKIGPQTVEERVVDFTHRSQFSNVIQDVAQGAVTFLGAQYNKLAGHVNTSFTRQHSSDQIPGKRLQSQLNKLKSSVRSRWDEGKEKVKETVDEKIDEVAEDHLIEADETEI